MTKKLLSTYCHSMPEANPLFNFGQRTDAVHHAQLRMGRSKLNAHLFAIGVIDSDMCACSTGIEDLNHYFMSCPLFADQRIVLFDSLAIYPINITTKILLEGAEQLTFEQNRMLFSMVHLYIKNTQRFNV